MLKPMTKQAIPTHGLSRSPAAGAAHNPWLLRCSPHDWTQLKLKYRLACCKALLHGDGVTTAPYTCILPGCDNLCVTGCFSRIYLSVLPSRTGL